MKRTLKILLLVFIIVVFIGTLVFLYQKSREKPVVYETQSPFITDIIKKTVVTGSVIPRKEIEIKPQIIGIIDEIYVQAGDIVANDDLIAKIKVTPNMVTLNNAQSRLKQAAIALDDARLTYERQKRFYEASFNDGHLILQKTNPSMIKLNSAFFKLNKAKITLEDAEKAFEKQKSLLEKSIVSSDEFQKAELNLLKAREDYKECNDNYLLVKEETLKILDQEYQKADLALKKAEAEFKASDDNLKLIREGVTDDVDSSNTLIKSTISGMILDVAVKEGSLVIESSTSNVGTTVATVADMNDMIFEGSIDESEVGKIREGMNLILTIGAIENKTFDAEIEYIAPKGKKVSGAIQFNIRAKLKLKDSDFVRAGYSANADIVLEEKNEVLAVKESWLIFEDEKTFVEIETKPQTYQKKEIEVGLSDGINISLLSGVSKEDKIKVPK